MFLHELDFTYPEELVATTPVNQTGSRVMWNDEYGPTELTMGGLLEKFSPGDVLVINNSKVIPRRLFDSQNRDILFVQLNGSSAVDWLVLLQLNQFERDEIILLPNNIKGQVVKGGLPQTLRLSQKIDESYFIQFGQMPLPPYIRKARGENPYRDADLDWYQSIFAKYAGSSAAPTASLHFQAEHIQQLIKRGVNIVELTLHVGLGTFLPIKAQHLDEHVMHSEWAEITIAAWQNIQQAKAQGNKVWALGTTVTRALEACAQNHLQKTSDSFLGETNLFIRPGFQFQVVDRLLTNFHQPRSTLLALVSAFAGRDRVMQAYQWAISNKFRLFSYGDLTVW